MKAKKNEDVELMDKLGIGPSRSRWRRWRWIILALVVVAIAAGYIVTRNKKVQSEAMRFKTKTAEKGTLLVTVTATGNLKPTNQVDVGSELSGNLKSVEVEYNDYVKKGQVLATIDGSKYEAQLMQLNASLESAKAQVLTAETSEKDAQDKLDRYKKVWELSGHKYPSITEMDTAASDLKRAQVSLQVAEANVSQAQANVEATRTDISKLVIRSPIDGIVLKRAYEPGQTVQASFQGVTLFTLAEDLTRMELHVDVDEADVGKVKENQDATFTVDAYPDRSFKARIRQVRYEAKTQSGVVTYETVLDVENSELLLRPGMTATAEIVVNRMEDVLLIDNDALMYTPPLIAMTPPESLKPAAQEVETAARDKKQQEVYILKDNMPSPVAITTGLTDGTMTEVTGGDLNPGTPIIIGIEDKNAAILSNTAVVF